MAKDPTERTLELLSLLQSRRQWPAAELAEHELEDCRKRLAHGLGDDRLDR